MHPLDCLHPPKVKCTPLNRRCTPLREILSKQCNKSKRQIPAIRRGSVFWHSRRGFEGRGSEWSAGGIAALHRRGRMKQSRNFRSRAASRAEPLRRSPGTASAARRKSEPSPGPPAGGESHPVRQEKTVILTGLPFFSFAQNGFPLRGSCREATDEVEKTRPPHPPPCAHGGTFPSRGRLYRRGGISAGGESHPVRQTRIAV